MKKNSFSKSGLLRGRLLLSLTLCSVSVLFTIFAAGGARRPQWGNGRLAVKRNAPAPASLHADKIEPALLTAAAQGNTEFVIYLTPVADLSGAASLPSKEAKGQFVFQQLTAAAEAAQPPVRQTLSSLGVEYRAFWVSNVIWAQGNLSVINTVAALPQVAYITSAGAGGGLKLPPQQREARASAPASPDAIDAIEDSLLSVNADDVWAMGYFGQGAVVAGADTGVRWTHSALKPHYRGWNGAVASHDYNWRDGIHNPNPGCPADSPEPCDDDVALGGGHGSHTVGTMVGDDGGNNRIGMAPQAQWIACRNMNEGVGVPVTGYLECMQFFLAPTKVDGTAPDPAKAPDVINNSWGCIEPGCAPEPNPPVPGFLRATLQASRAAGIVYVASAGNEGNDGLGDCSTLEFPLARYPESFTVGAINHRTNIAADFSSRGPVLGDPDFPTGLRKPDITAPGVSIRSVQRASDTAYGSLSGTSMSGPHVAGLVALVISANPQLRGDVDRIEEIIEQSATSMTTTQTCGGDTATSVPNNVFGWGRINALAAVQQALAEASPVPLLKVSSRKTHGGAGTFDVDLPLANAVGIECRSGEPNSGEHTIVFTFANPVANVGGAMIESGNGTIASRGPGADPREYVVNLSGVTNGQRLRLALTAVTDTAGNSTPTLSVGAGFLEADTTADGAVNSADITQTKSQSGAAVGSGNFRTDLNTDGNVNSADISQAKSRSGTALP